MKELHNLLLYAKENNINCIKELAKRTKEEFGLNVKPYTKDNITLWNFDYSQINSPKYNAVSDSCRGIVLDSEMNLVAPSFNRFYNYEEYINQQPEYLESFLKAPNTSNAIKILEKLDGSFIKTYYINELGWVQGTRGVPFAEQCDAFSYSNDTAPELNTKITFQDLIDRTLLKSHGKLINNIIPEKYKHYTFLFELCTKENKVVTSYETDKFVLINVIDNNTLKDIPFNEYLEIAKELNFVLPQIKEFETFGKLIKETKNLPDLKEGFIVLNTLNNKRIKIKNPTYVHAHHLRTNGLMSVKKAYQTFHEKDEILGYFPELKPWYDVVENAFVLFREKVIEVYYETLNNELLESMKDFAMHVNSLNIDSSVKFAVLKLSSGYGTKENCTDSAIQQIWDNAFDSHKINFINSTEMAKKLFKETFNEV